MSGVPVKMRGKNFVSSAGDVKGDGLRDLLCQVENQTQLTKGWPYSPGKLRSESQSKAPRPSRYLSVPKTGAVPQRAIDKAAGHLYRCRYEADEPWKAIAFAVRNIDRKF